MDCLLIPKVCPYFLLRSKTYLKNRPPVQVLQTGFPAVQLACGCGETGLHILQGANYTAAQWIN